MNEKNFAPRVSFRGLATRRDKPPRDTSNLLNNSQRRAKPGEAKRWGGTQAAQRARSTTSAALLQIARGA
jgi:hypothetical protein